MKRMHASLAVLLGGVLAAAAGAVFTFGSAASADDTPAAAPACPPPQKQIDHPYLAAMVGEWEVSFVATDPTGKTQEGKGTSKMTMGIAGTALLEDYAADMGGAPFAGHGITKVSDDGKTVSCWWLDNMLAEPMKLTGPLTESTIEMTGTIPGMGTMKIVSKKVDGGFAWVGTVGDKPMMSQKYRKAK